MPAGGDIGAPLPEGAIVGRYRVRSLLGEGGMGRVYRAVGEGDEEVALKLVKREFARDPVYVKRFEREARAAARISHPHVVAVVEAGEHEGQAYLIQQFVRGVPLNEKLEREGPMELRSSVRLCLEVGAGIDAVHGGGLVHRDLKPGNILLDLEGRAHITDFGLAKIHGASLLTKPGQVVGSMDYMAPEQIRGEEVSARTDVYALGCVIYECLCGGPPFADRKGMQILWAHLRDEPPDPRQLRPDLPADVGWTLLAAMAKEPERRPPSGTAFGRMLQIAAGRQSGGPPSG